MWPMVYICHVAEMWIQSDSAFEVLIIEYISTGELGHGLRESESEFFIARYVF